MPRRKKKSSLSVFITIVAFLTLILFLLRFDVVVNAIDPENKMKIGTFASDAFWLMLALAIVLLAVATIASVWTSVALIAVGVGIFIAKVYEIYNRKYPKTAPGQ